MSGIFKIRLFYHVLWNKKLDWYRPGPLCRCPEECSRTRGPFINSWLTGESSLPKKSFPLFEAKQLYFLLGARIGHRLTNPYDPIGGSIYSTLFLCFSIKPLQSLNTLSASRYPMTYVQDILEFKRVGKWEKKESKNEISSSSFVFSSIYPKRQFVALMNQYTGWWVLGNSASKMYSRNVA